MKVQFFVSFWLCWLSYTIALTKEEIKGITQGMLRECKEETKAKDEDLNAFNNKKLPTSHEGLCLVECFLDRVSIMKDGKFDKEGLVAAVGSVIKEEDKLKKLNELATVCDKKIGKGVDDKCENAKNVITCLMGEGKNFGIEFMTML